MKFQFIQKNLHLLLSFFFLILFIVIYSLSGNTTNYYIEADRSIEQNIQNKIQIFQKYEKKIFSQSDYLGNENIGITDVRAFVLDSYFNKNNSPLFGTGKDFVDACDRFGAPEDCIVVVAIARNESNLCKYLGSEEMKNCWGYGGPGIYRWKFDSFRSGIFQVTDILVNRYGLRFMEDPRLMERTFCGTEPTCPQWGENILFFMKEINDYSESLIGRKLKNNLIVLP